MTWEMSLQLLHIRLKNMGHREGYPVFPANRFGMQRVDGFEFQFMFAGRDKSF